MSPRFVPLPRLAVRSARSWKRHDGKPKRNLSQATCDATRRCSSGETCARAAHTRLLPRVYVHIRPYTCVHIRDMYVHTHIYVYSRSPFPAEERLAATSHIYTPFVGLGRAGWSHRLFEATTAALCAARSQIALCRLRPRDLSALRDTSSRTRLFRATVNSGRPVTQEFRQRASARALVVVVVVAVSRDTAGAVFGSSEIVIRDNAISSRDDGRCKLGTR